MITPPLGGGPYCTIQELAAELGVRVDATTTPKLTACVGAAAQEINHAVDRTTAIPASDPLAKEVNLLRAVEWWKASQAAFGVIGFAETGALQAPRDGFARHARTLIPLRQRWGIA